MAQEIKKAKRIAYKKKAFNFLLLNFLRNRRQKIKGSVSEK